MADTPDLEEQKRLLLPFLQRAQEIQGVDPKVAYYCRLYACEQALKIPVRHKEITSLLASVMGKLESSKAQLSLDEDNDKIQCENFADRIFSNADRADRAGKADANTAKAFLAASYFMEILNHFGEMETDLAGKQRYCGWRAAEIRKAIREGRAPQPPPSLDVAARQQAAGGGMFDPGPGGLEGATTPTQGGPSGPPQLWGPPDAQWGEPHPGPQDAAPSSHWQGQDLSHMGGASTRDGAAFPPGGALSTSAGPGAAHGVSGGPAMGMHSVGPAGALVQRYRPGSLVLYCADTSAFAERFEQGTVAQVLGPGGGAAPSDPPEFRYRVALPQRLVEAGDSQLAPCCAEGSTLLFREEASDPQVLVEVTMCNDATGWPPSYLVRLPNGHEVPAEVSQVSMIPDMEANMPPAMPAPHGMGAAPPPLQPAHPQGPPPSAPSGGQRSFHEPGPPQGSLPSLNATAPPAVQSYSANARQSAPPPPPASYHSSPPPGPQPGPYGPASGGSYPAAGMRPPPSNPAYGGPSAPPPPVAAPPTGGGMWAPAGPPGFKPSLQAMSDAQKAARVAISSLNFEDTSSAIKSLTHAIELLTGATGR